MRSRSLLAMTIVAFLLGTHLSSSAVAAAKPNVLIILADDLGYSDLGCYGGEIVTPNVDQLAKAGLRFTQFYNTARCWPSRAALMTGYYAQQINRDAHFENKRGSGQGTRPAWAPLLPALLKPLGYRSYHSGKWHLDGPSLPAGFDHSYILEDHNRNFYPTQHSLDDKRLPPVERGTDYYTTTAVADHAIAFLKDHARDHKDQPFFQYLAFTVPHFPLQAPQKDIDRYRERYLAGWNALQAERAKRLKELGITNHDAPAMEQKLGPPYRYPNGLDSLGDGEVLLPLPWDSLTSEQREFQATKMAIHAAMVDRMDQEIGRVLAQIEAMGATENTAVFFLSDNGASAEVMVRGDNHDPKAAPGSGASYLCLGPGFSSAANTPFRRHKTWVHEGGISTPFIASWPEGIAARGQLRQTPAHVIDLVPTIVELAGGKLPTTWKGQPVPPAPGRSLTSVFTGDAKPLHDHLWWLHDNHRALRVGDWKLVAAHGDPWELYDLSKDRGETNNLAPQHPDKVRQLESLWTQDASAFQTLSGPAAPPKAAKAKARPRGAEKKSQ